MHNLNYLILPLIMVAYKMPYAQSQFLPLGASAATARPITPQFTPINPFQLLMNLPTPGKTKPTIMNVQRKHSFRSGGVELQFVMLSMGQPLPADNRLLYLYFDANNNSTNKTEATETIETPCRKENSFIFCLMPNVERLFPDFTADKYDKPMLVETFGTFACKPQQGKKRLCYALIGDGQMVSHNMGALSVEGMEDVMRVSQALSYFPDPMIWNVTVQNQKRLKITGFGLQGENPLLLNSYSISLAGGRVRCAVVQPATTDPFVLLVTTNSPHPNVTTTTIAPTTTEPPNHSNSQIFCDFDNARLMNALDEIHGVAYVALSRDIAVGVSMKNGNWATNSTVVYNLGHSGWSTPVPSRDRDSLPPEIIIAIVVPICFISIVIAAACVAICYMRYSYSDKATKYTERMDKFCPGAFRSFYHPPAGRRGQKDMPDDFTQLMRLLPPDMAKNVEQHRIDSNRVRSGAELGKGYFGIVRRGTIMSPKDSKTNGKNRRINANSDSLKNPGDAVALKFIQQYSDVEQLREFFQEAVYMFDFDHPNVLGAHGVASIDGYPAVVLPLMEAGDLRNFVQLASSQITDPHIVDFGRQIARGMRYLHEKHIVHRDLAARNCLLNLQRVVKVADFGLSRMCDGQDQNYDIENYTIKTNGRPMPVRWMAPESLTFGSFSEKSDVWSFGVVLWELASRGARPYPAVETSYIKRHIVEEKQRPSQLPIISDCLYELMMSCWNEHSSVRPTFGELCTRTDALLDDPQSPLWMNPNTKYQYHDPKDLDSMLNETLAESLRALSGEGILKIQPQQTVDVTVSEGNQPYLERKIDETDSGRHGSEGAVSSNSDPTTTPNSHFSSEYNTADSGILHQHPDLEANPSGMSQYDKIEKMPIRDVDSVFISPSSRPGTPSPPDSAISGMSLFPSSRHSWFSRSFSSTSPPSLSHHHNRPPAVTSSPSTESSHSSASPNGSPKQFQLTSALSGSIKRSRPNKLNMLQMHTLTRLDSDLGSLSSPGYEVHQQQPTAEAR